MARSRKTGASDNVSNAEALKIVGSVALFGLLIAWFFIPPAPGVARSSPPFSGFTAEAEEFNELLKCPNGRITPADEWSGALYGCQLGATKSDELAKFWINETAGNPGQVENIKVMWNNPNDRNPNYPVHGDKAEAAEMVRVLVSKKIPSLNDEIFQTYFNNQSRTFKSELYDIEYRWTPGPGINEHLLILSARK